MDPAEKKAIAYRKDHRYGGEYPHAFRRNFPRKRARANRDYRRRVQQYLIEHEQAIQDEAESSLPPVRRDIVRKWGATPLGEWIAYRQEMRLHHTARKYLGGMYDSTEDKERFAGFLATITADDSPYAHSVARYFNELLHVVPAPKPTMYTNHQRHGERFEAFLQDFPAWREPLRAWIEKAMDDGR